MILRFNDFYLLESVTDNPIFNSWFNGSKIVNKDGTPKILYHGSKGKFDTFNYKNLGVQGRSEGAGFYFTDKEDVAKGYGDQLYKVYLRIKKPLDTNDPNFNRNVIKKIIKKIVDLQKKDGIDEGDGFLSNFGDISFEGMNSVIEAAVDAHVDEDSATDLQGSLIGAGVNPQIVNNAIFEVTGHDGIIAHGFGGLRMSDTMIYIPFFANQIKSIDNKTFNINSDNMNESNVDKYKYPRTPHVPWSEQPTADDKILKSTENFVGKDIVVTEKMDGENCTSSREYTHARSLDSNNHPSRNWVKRFHSEIKQDIPKGWRICGENLYAKHSIHYEELPSYFLVFSIWNEKNYALSWDDTVEWCNLIGLKHVPVLWRGVWNEDAIKKLFDSSKSSKTEGYVIRNADSFSYNEFANNVAKFVRKGHVQPGGEHWMTKSIVPNKLKP